MCWSKLYKFPAISLRFFNTYGLRSRTSGAVAPGVCGQRPPRGVGVAQGDAGCAERVPVAA